MRYADYRKLTEEERKRLHWRHHPRVRVATIFTILFAIALAAFLLRVLQNRRIHVNRKPNTLEAYAVAKMFVKDKLKQPATATFPKSSNTAVADTANNVYEVGADVTSQDSSGKIIKTQWQVKLSYTGGDWADRNNWRLISADLRPENK